MNLTKYVGEQKRKSIELRKLATETKDFEKSQELRKQQDKEYKKFLFLHGGKKMEELKITKEDIELLKEMKDNCLKTNVYDDEKRLLKANAITKFLVEHEKKQELIDYLKEKIKKCEELIIKHKQSIKGIVNISDNNRHLILIKTLGIEKQTYQEILSKIEKE